MAFRGGEKPDLEDRPWRLAEPVPPRMAMLQSPHPSVIESYYPTAAAERALATLDGRRNMRTGALFWIAGEPGSGKTHFLNYVVALERKSERSASEGRRIVAAIGADERNTPFDLEGATLEAFATAITGAGHGSRVWHRIGGQAALESAVSEAYRLGIREVFAAIDLSLSDPTEFGSVLAELARLASHSHRVRIVIVVAGRGPGPPGVTTLGVAPASAAETAAAAIARARLIVDQSEANLAKIRGLYSNFDCLAFVPDEIFPFHPLAAQVLTELAENRVGTGAQLARAALAELNWNSSVASLVVPGHIIETGVGAQALAERMGVRERAALDRLYHLIQTEVAQKDQASVRLIVNTLVLHRAVAKAPALELEGLWASLTDGHQVSASLRLLKRIAARSRGAIRILPGAAVFEPLHDQGLRIDQYNAALELVRYFDPDAVELRSARELGPALARLEAMLTTALHEAREAAQVLEQWSDTAGIGPDSNALIAQYSKLVESGASGLVALGGRIEEIPQALAILAEFRKLSAAARQVPALMRGRHFLADTGLLGIDLTETPVDSELARLALEARLIDAELDGKAAFSAVRNSLGARLERLRLTYAHQYSTAHEKRRTELAQAIALVDDFRRYAAVLRRLNAIEPLGPPDGETLLARAPELVQRCQPCAVAEPPAAFLEVRCSRCNFQLGQMNPEVQMRQTFEDIQEAVRARLARVANSAIDRLIERYDRSGRLKGFLKITQAAQTDALVRVLDDRLASYLDRLLREEGN